MGCSQIHCVARCCAALVKKEAFLPAQRNIAQRVCERPIIIVVGDYGLLSFTAAYNSTTVPLRCKVVTARQ